MNLFKSSLSIVALSMSLMACSAEIKTDGEPPKNIFPQSEKTDLVKGPNIQGTWLSGCNVEKFSHNGEDVEGSIIIEQTVTGRNVKRVTQYFSDKTCLLALRTDTLSGTYRYTEQRPDDVYIIAYAFVITGGGGPAPQEQIKMDGKNLWVSNFGYNVDILMTQKGVVDCGQRKVEMDALSTKAQNRLEEAYENFTRGLPVATSKDLREEADKLAQKYGEMRCDGQQTTESFVKSINVTADGIEDLRR